LGKFCPPGSFVDLELDLDHDGDGGDNAADEEVVEIHPDHLTSRQSDHCRPFEGEWQPCKHHYYSICNGSILDISRHI
jgi:hypothetical protein